MRIVALKHKALAVLAALIALSALGGPSTASAAGTSVTPSPSSIIVFPGTWFDSGVTLAQDVQASSSHTSILISDMSLLREGWTVIVGADYLPEGGPNPDREHMLIEHLTDGGFGNPDTMVVQRGVNGTPKFHASGGMVRAHAVTVGIYAKDVTDTDGLGAFQVYMTLPPGVELIKMTGETAWLGSTDRVVYPCDPVLIGDTWQVTCSTSDFTVTPETGARCTNAIDDDADTVVNDGCPAAGPTTPETGAQCANASDDDADTVVNDGCPAAGPPAPETGAQCADAIDDDADGAVNDGCPQEGTEPETANQCVNAIDDDDDTVVNDGCPAEGPPTPETGAQCVNASDDDADTVVNDGCPVAGPPTSETGAQCGNKLDDDADTLVNDGCPAAPDPETGVQCANAIDNDADTVVNDGCPAAGEHSLGPKGSGLIAKVTLLPSEDIGTRTVSLGAQLVDTPGNVIPATVEDLKIAVLYCPDANLDGKVNSGDSGMIRKNFLDKGVDSGATLVNQVDASQTNMGISDQSLLLPILPNNTISIDAEQMTLQALQEGTPDDTMTVARAIYYSPATPHNAGAHIYRATSGGIDGKMGYTRPRDVNRDGSINAGDTGIVARAFGMSCPVP